MPLRSILLATTLYVAIGSFSAVGPASAHGFGPGGFTGGQSGPAFAARSPGVSSIGRTPVQPVNDLGGGAKLDHVPSIATPAVQGSISSAREPIRIPAVPNAIVTNSAAAMQSVRPAQLPPTITSSGSGERQQVDATGIANAPRPGQVSTAGVASYPVNRLGSTEGVPNVTGGPRIIGHDPAPDHITASQGAAYANAKAGVDTLTAKYLIPSPPDAAEEARQKRIADLRQTKRDLMAQVVVIEAKIAGIKIQAAEADQACKAEIAALEQGLQKTGGDAGAATGAVVGGVVGGPLGALAGAAVGATIGPTAAAAAAAVQDLSGCKQEVDLETQIPDLLKQLSVLQAALANVDAALAKALKEEADEAREQPHDARIGNLTGPSRPQSATK